MTSTMEKLLTAALERPDHDRPALIEALIESVEPSGQPRFEESWRELIRR